MSLGYSVYPVKTSAFKRRPLDFTISSACWDLDATLIQCFPGSGQTWANAIKSPADGSSQTAYDFHLGQTSSSNTDDPTFTGNAGRPAAYFSLDGGDHWKAKTSATTDMVTINKMHQTVAGNAWWIGFAFQYSDSGAAQQLFRADITTIPTFSSGVAANIKTDDTIFFHRRESDASQSFDQNTNTVATLTGGTDYLILISRDEDTDSLDFWINSGTVTEAFTVNWTANTTGATDDAGSPDTARTPTIAAREFTVVDFQMANNTRFYGFYGGNEFLNDTKAGNIRTALQTRHGRTY